MVKCSVCEKVHGHAQDCPVIGTELTHPDDQPMLVSLASGQRPRTRSWEEDLPVPGDEGMAMAIDALHHVK